MELLADGEVVQEKDLTAADGWEVDFGNLPKYKDGEKITYTVQERTRSRATPSPNPYTKKARGTCQLP